MKNLEKAREINKKERNSHTKNIKHINRWHGAKTNEKMGKKQRKDRNKF